jgi:uncharacterized Zn finger protein (UPF0148 family)
MYCPECGGPLACYEGESYCPACTWYEVEREALQALDEAVLLRRVEAGTAAAGGGPADDDLPF